jgi:hypothetical protein
MDYCKRLVIEFPKKLILGPMFDIFQPSKDNKTFVSLDLVYFFKISFHSHLGLVVRTHRLDQSLLSYVQGQSG